MCGGAPLSNIASAFSRPNLELGLFSQVPPAQRRPLSSNACLTEPLQPAFLTAANPFLLVLPRADSNQYYLGTILKIQPLLLAFSSLKSIKLSRLPPLIKSERERTRKRGHPRLPENGPKSSYTAEANCPRKPTKKDHLYKKTPEENNLSRNRTNALGHLMSSSARVRKPTPRSEWLTAHLSDPKKTSLSTRTHAQNPQV